MFYLLGSSVHDYRLSFITLFTILDNRFVLPFQIERTCCYRFILFFLLFIFNRY